MLFPRVEQNLKMEGFAWKFRFRHPRRIKLKLARLIRIYES